MWIYKLVLLLSLTSTWMLKDQNFDQKMYKKTTVSYDYQSEDEQEEEEENEELAA